jgi:hypothetical protein
MRAAGVIPVVLSVAVLASPTTSWAVFETYASYRYGGLVQANPDLNGSFSGNLTSIKVGPTITNTWNEVEKEFLESAFGTYGFANLRGTVRARAKGKRLGVSLYSEIYAENHTLSQPTVQDIAYAEYDRANGVVVTAGFKDVSTITAPDVPIGTVLVGSGTMFFDGLLSTVAHAVGSGDFLGPQARAEVTITVTDHTGSVVYATGTSLNTSPDSDIEGITSPPEVVDIPFVYRSGIPREWGIFLQVRGFGHVRRTVFSREPLGSSTSVLTGDYHDTLTWGGITSLVNAATGEPVENWTITSESGLDYSKPFVPEPSSAVLLSFSLCAWLGWARPRRH